MDAAEFREFGRAAVDFIADYIENIRDRSVLPSVEPGYLQHLLPQNIPKEPENWKDVLKDLEKFILPGITHWQSPQFHAYFPTASSYPAIIGELLSAGFGIVGFSWITSPACTELEVIMMDWLGKLIHLPEEFLNCSDGPGGGIIQGSASEATFICLLAAKERMLRRIAQEHPDWDPRYVSGKMVAYTSEHSNSSVEKAGLLGSVPMRLLPTDDNGSLRGEVLLQKFEEDISKGFIPTYVCATLGTTGTCAFDNLHELAPICKKYNVWIHVDAAYAGAACVCPEYRYLMSGVELCDSFNFNLHKWLLVNFDCSAMWVKDSNWLVDAFNVERIYLKHHKQGNPAAPDYRHWQISLGRRFRSLKVWITLRIYGEKGLQDHIRKQINLAKEFEKLLLRDPRFELVSPTVMGLVCFRLKGINSITKALHERLMSRKNIYLVAATLRNQFFIRFVVCSRLCNINDILFAWKEIESQANIVLQEAEELSDRHSLVIMNGPKGEVLPSINNIKQTERST